VVNFQRSRAEISQRRRFFSDISVWTARNHIKGKVLGYPNSISWNEHKCLIKEKGLFLVKGGYSYEESGKNTKQFFEGEMHRL
jgi:hypothetical protein